MAEIKVETDLAKLPVWINKKVLKQIKYASSVALYETAVEAQKVVRENLSEDFTIRTSWVPRNIRTEPKSSRAVFRSAKGDMANMEIRVGTVDDFMVAQELGGVKDPKRKERRLAIPKRTHSGEIINKSKWPKAILKKPGYFLWTRPKDKRGFVFHRAQKERYPITLKYSFAESVKIPPRWHFYGTVEVIVQKKYNDIFMHAFDRAMATAK